MKGKVVFIHIPKTAGTSFYQNCYYQYPLFKFFHYHDDRYDGLVNVADDFRINDYLSLPVWLKKRVIFHAGHMPFGFHKAVASNQTQYVTFLRDPINRVISNYNHIRFHTHHPLNRLVLEEDISLRDFVLDKRFPFSENFMTRVLSGTFSDDKVNLFYYDRAISNIKERGMIVGITEEYSKSLALIALELKWKRPLLETYENRGQAEVVDQDDEVIELIKSLNTWDLRLYEEMKEQFHSRLLNNTSQIEGLLDRMIKPKALVTLDIKIKMNLVRATNISLFS